MSIFLRIVLGLVVVAESPTASSPAPLATQPAPAQPVTQEQLDRWITELGHPQFAVRQAARRRLCSLDAGWLEELGHRYLAATDYEIRQSIQHAVESIFCRQQIAGRDGFLGVSIASQLDRGLVDPSTGKRTWGVLVPWVLEGMAAARGGLRPNDVIIAVDGQPVPDEPTSEGFRKMIAARTPGDALAMRIMRPDEMTRQVALKVERRDGKPFVGFEADAPPLAGGLGLGPRIVRTVADSPAHAAGLRVNETIDAISGRPTTGPGGFGTLTSLLQTADEGTTIVLLVRSCREVTLDVTLGARPASHLDPADRAQASRRFLRWWHEHTGEAVLPTARHQNPDRTIRPPRSQPADAETTVIP